MQHAVDQLDRARRQTPAKEGRVECREIGRRKFLERPLTQMMPVGAPQVPACSFSTTAGAPATGKSFATAEGKPFSQSPARPELNERILFKAHASATFTK